MLFLTPHSAKGGFEQTLAYAIQNYLENCLSGG